MPSINAPHSPRPPAARAGRELLEALKGLSPLDSGYCFCSRADDAPDYRHAAACRAARQAIARAEACETGRERP